VSEHCRPWGHAPSRDTGGMSKSTSCAQTAHWNRLSAPDPATLTRTERMRSVPGAIAPSIFRQTRFRGDRFLAKRRLAPTRASNHFSL